MQTGVVCLVFGLKINFFSDKYESERLNPLN